MRLLLLLAVACVAAGPAAQRAQDSGVPAEIGSDLRDAPAAVRTLPGISPGGWSYQEPGRIMAQRGYTMGPDATARAPRLWGFWMNLGAAAAFIGLGVLAYRSQGPGPA